MLTETSDYAKLYGTFRWNVPEHSNIATAIVDNPPQNAGEGMRIMNRHATAAIAATFLLALPVHLHAAPQALLNKTVTVSFEVAIPAVNSAGQAKGTRRSVQRIMYVSSAGRIFVRAARQAGRYSEQKDIAPGGADGVPHFEGNTIVGTFRLLSGANRLVVTFDSSFQSCTATVILGREGGRALNYKGVDGEVYTATGSASVTTPSCSIQAGNAFAG